MFRLLHRLFGGKERQSEMAVPPATTPVEVSKSPPAPEPPATPIQSTQRCLPSQKGVSISTVSIFSRLPNYLTPLIRNSSSKQILIPLSHIVPQLPLGRISLPFGLLRQLTPPETFTNSPQFDATLVDLPLSEILAQLDASYYARRSQIPFQAPAHIPDLFEKSQEVVEIKPFYPDPQSASSPSQKPSAHGKEN